MPLTEHTEHEIAEVLAAYDLLCELYGTSWVRQRDLADAAELPQRTVYNVMNMLIICREFERFAVTGAHVRYRWIGGGE
jgi:hypothetical protein